MNMSMFADIALKRSVRMSITTDREKEWHDRRFKNDPRSVVEKYYSIVGDVKRRYDELVTSKCKSSQILECGCGLGLKAFELAEKGANVTAIDISDTAIRLASDRAREIGLTRVIFRRMNAEALEFEQASFDIVCGSGILHHLNLENAYREMARVLKDDGFAVCVEPLGHNPLINIFRKLTPNLRTKDEHPLRLRDIELARRFFGEVKCSHFSLMTLGAVFLRKLPFFERILRLLSHADQWIFRFIPFTKRFSWIALLEFRKPRRSPFPDITRADSSHT